MTPKAVLLRAAQLLDEDAQLTYECCERATDPPQPWACDDCVKDEDGKCNAMRAHDERTAISAKLQLMAEVA